MLDDVRNFQNFYQTSLGQHCQIRLQKLLGEVWPQLEGQSLLAIGYPIPYMEAYRNQVERLCVFMKGRTGVVGWPHPEGNLTALVDYEELPLPEKSFDRILLIHSLEHEKHSHTYLRELWRVLKDNGRLLVIVPHRHSIWSQIEETPFGIGNPYTRLQLARLLRERFFMPTRSLQGLYIWPTHNVFLQSCFPFWDTIGPLMLERFSGVLVMEAVKQVYGGVWVHQRSSTSLSLQRRQSFSTKPSLFP